MKKSDGSGREAAVVQAFAYTKYLGKIRSVKIRPKVWQILFRLTFDDSGHLTNWSGNPILLDKHVLEDAKVCVGPITALHICYSSKAWWFLKV